MRNAIAACVLAGLSLGAAAETATLVKQGGAEGPTLEIGLGRMQAESREYVYRDDGSTLSRLDWKASNVPILKAGVTYSPNSTLTLGLRGWTAITGGDNSMHDFDWMVPGQSQWSHRSYSPDTRLHSAYEIDLSATAWLWQRPTWKLGVVAGYQQNFFNWTAYGGDFSYWNGARTGSFPAGQPGISYRQTFRLPYVGVAGRYREQDWEFNALFKFSPWVAIDDHDTHHLRTLDFTESSRNSRYYGVNLDAGYYLTPNAKLYAEVSWNKFMQGRGPTLERNASTGAVNYYGGDAAGMDNKNYAVTIGVKYRF